MFPVGRHIWEPGAEDARQEQISLDSHGGGRRSGATATQRAKQNRERDAARLASAEATDRWAALVLAAYTQPRLASALVDDLRRPWHNKPAPGQMLSPYRVRLGFRRLRTLLGTPAGTAKTTRPGPGRPSGSKTGPRPAR